MAPSTFIDQFTSSLVLCGVRRSSSRRAFLASQSLSSSSDRVLLLPSSSSARVIRPMRLRVSASRSAVAPLPRAGLRNGSPALSSEETLAGSVCLNENCGELYKANEQSRQNKR